jgi:hypothetical protein
MKISELLSNITPHYNNYKSNKSKISAFESIIIMWEIGFFIEGYTKNNNISPHNLYREIYGKSESANNIAQKSYITREFLSRCLRIYKMFASKNEIKLKFPSLGDFSSFREAMPFFDNPVYKLTKIEEADLFKLLNSNKKGTDIVKALDKKKKSINNISNSRNQRLNDLDNEVKIFKEFYNLVYKNIRDNNYDVCINNLNLTMSEVDKFLNLSKNLSALSQEGVLKFEMNEYIFKNDVVNKFYHTITILMKPNDEKIRRRFRRLIPPGKIIQLAEYVYSLGTNLNFNNIKSKI